METSIGRTQRQLSTATVTQYVHCRCRLDREFVTTSDFTIGKILFFGVLKFGTCVSSPFAVVRAGDQISWPVSSVNSCCAEHRLRFLPCRDHR